MSRTDPLTGLSNRRDMMERLEAESSRFERYGVPFSVLIFDLDDFKLVNDRFGHGSGDRVLRNVASVFRRELRQSDCCSRWGGEEFLILCPGTDLGGATSVGEKCRTAIADARVELREGEVSVTASGGVCAMKPGYDVDGLIRRADEALYRAKAAGKGVLVASP
jgi:diguanylate cyclase (GGDEF)-like protein